MRLPALLVFLLVLGLAGAAAQAQTRPTTATLGVLDPTTTTLSVSIAIPVQDGKRFIQYSADGHSFRVVVRNVSARPVNLWTPKYSWGYANLSFEVRDASGLVRTVQKAEREWRKNFPDSCTLLPGDDMVLDVDFTSSDWSGAPRPSTGTKFAVVSMRAVYQILPDEESQKLKVWTGRVESPWREYTLVP